MHIPLVDCDQKKRGDAAIVAEIDRALRDCGFLSVTGLGLESSAIDDIFQASARFFSQDASLKARCSYGSAEENFGYQALGAESLDPARPADLKESFTMRNLLAAPIADGRWPDREFRDSVCSFYKRAWAAASRLQRLLAIALGLRPEFFVDCHSGENVTLRLLHYPAISDPALDDGQMGAGAHTDYGLLTLLIQDGVGGLQVRDAMGNWHDVPPRRSTIVVNSGDLLERWSNGRYRSTVHRVLPRRCATRRFSVALFVDPDSATEVEVLASCVDDQHPAAYPRTTAGEHLTEKILATHRRP